MHLKAYLVNEKKNHVHRQSNENGETIVMIKKKQALSP